VRQLAIAASALVLVLAAAGCGGGGGSSSHGKQSHTVSGLSKAFYDAGIPFTSETTYNPYVQGQAVYLPGKLNTSDLRSNVLAGLAMTGSFNGVDAVVFDTDAHAAQALKVVPLSQWGTQADSPIVRLHDGNVVLVAAGFRGGEAKKLQTALSNLKTDG